MEPLWAAAREPICTKLRRRLDYKCDSLSAKLVEVLEETTLLAIQPHVQWARDFTDEPDVMILRSGLSVLEKDFEPRVHSIPSQDAFHTSKYTPALMIGTLSRALA